MQLVQRGSFGAAVNSSVRQRVHCLLEVAVAAYDTKVPGRHCFRALHDRSDVHVGGVDSNSPRGSHSVKAVQRRSVDGVGRATCHSAPSTQLGVMLSQTVSAL